ncbi:unnamed protein product [Somion occarium]|uniref:WD40 repeat-like protein n=1 Tax=Somion occarium TaxID=3059160 RepID=A0ABP1CGK4_9APHY
MKPASLFGKELLHYNYGWFGSDGQFYLLFNATKGESDPRNMNGVPQSFQPLELPRQLFSDSSNHMEAGQVCTSIGVDVSKSRSPTGVECPPITITLQKDKAAFLVSQTTAGRKHIMANDAMPEYMLRNRDNWHRLAQGMRHAVHKDEIVMISGWVKTRSWVLGLGQKRGTTMIVNGVAADNANEGLRVDSTDPSSVTRRGPAQFRLQSGQINPLRDQCIFLNYYKAKSRIFAPPKLEANAGPHNLPDSNEDPDNERFDVTTNNDVETTSGDDDDIEIAEYPPVPSNHHPIDAALDFILESAECDVAIASDVDVHDILEGVPWPDDVNEFLKRRELSLDIGEDKKVGKFSVKDMIVRKYQNLAAHRHDNEPIPPEPTDQPGPSSAEHSDYEQDESTIPTADGRWRASAIIPGKIDGDTFEWPHIKLSEPDDDEAGATCPAAVSPDGKLVAAGFEDAVVRVWDIDTGALMLKLQAHADNVAAVAFSPDCSKLVSGSADGVAIVWSTYTGENLAQLVGHEGDIWCLAYSPDGATVATGSIDCTVKLWDAHTYDIIHTLDDHPSVVQCMAFSSDSSLLVTSAQDQGKVWNTRTGHLVSSLSGHENVVWAVSFSPDGRRIVTGSEDNTSRIWNSATGDELVTIREHTNPVWTVQFSPDGQEVLSGSYDSTISLCDSYLGTQRNLLRNVASTVTSAAYSPDGDYIASGYSDGSVNVWNAKKGTIMADFKGHEDKVKAVIFSPDGQEIVSSSDDGSVRVWSMEDVVRLVPTF